MNVAVVYFSLTGNTEKVALEIKRQLEEKNIRISQIKLKGGESNFLGNSLKAMFRKRAEIEQGIRDFSEFDFIFVGSPVWALSPTPQVNTFLDMCSGLEGKKGTVFVTYKSGTGKDRALKMMKRDLLKKGMKEVCSFAVSNKTISEEGNLKKKMEFALASSPLSYKTKGGENE
jgi:flavodoxin